MREPEFYYRVVSWNPKFEEWRHVTSSQARSGPTVYESYDTAVRALRGYKGNAWPRGSGIYRIERLPARPWEVVNG